MSELDLLTTMLDTKIEYHQITTDGNCFFHALEYALGNCEIEDTKNPLYNETRQQVSDLLLSKYNHELKEIQDRIERVRGTDLLKERIKEQILIQKKIAFIHHFHNSLEYSTEEVIYFSALLKEKILFIVRDQMFDGEFQTTLVIPQGVRITRDNFLVMIHSNGNHYNTLTYPLTMTDKFLTMIRRYKASEDGIRSTDVEGIYIKFGSLNDVLKYYVGLEEIRKTSQIKSNHEMALRLAGEVNLDKESHSQVDQEAMNRIFAENLEKQFQEITIKNVSRKKKSKSTSPTKKFWNPFRRHRRTVRKPPESRSQSLNRKP